MASLKDFSGEEVEKTALQELSSLINQKYRRIYNAFIQLVDTVIDYCIEKNEKSFESLIKYLLRSKLLKPYNIQYEDLIAEAQKTIDEFNKIIKELNKDDKQRSNK